MKKSILLLLFILATTSIYAQKKIKGNGNVTTITRSTSEYDSIECTGSFNYVLVSGTEGHISIKGEENLLEYIVTEVKNGHLILKSENRMNLAPSKNNSIIITIPFKEINAVSLTGSGDLRAVDLITSLNFKATLTGSGELNLNLQTSLTKASVAGSGELTIKGNTDTLVVEVSGSGIINGLDLQSNNTDVSVAGSGTARVNSKESIKARVSGSGKIKYSGNPNQEDTKVSGSGSISN